VQAVRLQGSMSQADGYIEIPAQTDIVEKGEMVVVTLF
jgi:molybdopterin biosynthesis enzyme